jgi:hypothetical protein
MKEMEDGSGSLLQINLETTEKAHVFLLVILLPKTFHIFSSQNGYKVLDW